MSARSMLLRIFALVVIDAFGLQLALGLGSQFSLLLGIGIFILTAIINVVFLVDKLYPWRWLAPGVALMILMVIYPLSYTVFVAFTNYSDGHLLTKEQVVQQFLGEYYKPADAVTYKWTAFLSPPPPDTPLTVDNLIFWLVDPSGKAYVVSTRQGDLVASTNAEATFGKFGERDSDGIPKSIDGFTRLSRLEVVRYLKTVQNVVFKDGPYQIHITSLDSAPRLLPKYSYDAKTDILTDNETGTVYHTERGTFVTGEGETRHELTPGFAVVTGFNNFLRVVDDPNIRGPFVNVFLWTIMFALGSVVTTFALGLAFALTLNSPDLPLRPFLRSVLIIPYAMPAFISVLVWVGLLNPIYGPINILLKQVFGISPQWFADPTLAKIGILLVNLWLGYPYMMLITTGALQSIPSDIYEAALIDGANDNQQFRFITLPLLLVSVGPLLIGSFAFNFNNFAVIELFNKGGPPMSALTPAGHTDILISYTYRLAFGGTKGIDYGFASAITVFIFAIVAAITIFNFRFTRQFEQVSENV